MAGPAVRLIARGAAGLSSLLCNTDIRRAYQIFAILTGHVDCLRCFGDVIHIE